jgi:hypothetical protein
VWLRLGYRDGLKVAPTPRRLEHNDMISIDFIAIRCQAVYNQAQVFSGTPWGALSLNCLKVECRSEPTVTVTLTTNRPVSAANHHLCSR